MQIFNFNKFHKYVFLIKPYIDHQERTFTQNTLPNVFANATFISLILINVALVNTLAMRSHNLHEHCIWINYRLIIRMQYTYKRTRVTNLGKRLIIKTKKK